MAIELNQLIKPTWSMDLRLTNVWNGLNDDEKQGINERVDAMFCNGLPFQLEHDKIQYIHLFSLFAQLEIAGLDGLMELFKSLEGTELEQRSHLQMNDEIFHAIVFTKIAYTLSAPYAQPPRFNKAVDQFRLLLVNEPDVKTSVVLLTLVGESLIEELFITMKKNRIAPQVFDVVIADESRHIKDSELYLQMGLPDADYLQKKLIAFEEASINMFSQLEYLVTLVNLIGYEQVMEMFYAIDKKYSESLALIHFKPSDNWRLFLKNMPSLMKGIMYDHTKDTVVEKSMTRKLASARWGDPDQPTQSAMFGIDVTSVEFFEKKYPSDVITCLSLQAISKSCSDTPVLRNYMYNHKIYSPQHSYIGLAVHLPQFGDHLGMIEFKDCHEMSYAQLAQHIQQDLKIMAYCCQKTQELQVAHPYLRDAFNHLLIDRPQEFYFDPLFPRPTICLSNIGHWGYEAAISPLFPNETVKFTLMKVERKQVWNNATKQFEIQDRLPVGLSVDHRVFDANFPIPSIFQKGFTEAFCAMESMLGVPPSPSVGGYLEEFIALTDDLLEKDLDFGFRFLFFSSHMLANYRTKEAVQKTKKLFNKRFKKGLGACS